MSGRVALALPVSLGCRESNQRAGVAAGARCGLTLVEIILVLSLLVIIGAVSVPLLQGSLTRSRLSNGGERLRAAWSRARLAATQSGQAYAFRFVPKGSRFQIMPLADLADAGAVPLDALVDDAESEGGDSARQPDNSLPEGVTFAAGQVSAAPQLEAGATTSSAWSTPILFHPDGTTSDAVVILANEEDLTLRVTLRGLTGIARVSDIGSEVVP
jgi:type II secretory pathway pseudopilin PulG